MKVQDAAKQITTESLTPIQAAFLAAIEAQHQYNLTNEAFAWRKQKRFELGSLTPDNDPRVLRLKSYRGCGHTSLAVKLPLLLPTLRIDCVSCHLTNTPEKALEQLVLSGRLDILVFDAWSNRNSRVTNPVGTWDRFAADRPETTLVLLG